MTYECAGAFRPESPNRLLAELQDRPVSPSASDRPTAMPHHHNARDQRASRDVGPDRGRLPREAGIADEEASDADERRGEDAGRLGMGQGLGEAGVLGREAGDLGTEFMELALEV